MGSRRSSRGGSATIFGVALIASGFASSSVGTMAGQVVMQGFIRRRIPIFLRRAITLAPALLVLAIGFNPTDALVLSQVVLSFGIPFALVPLLLIARDRELMGSLASPPWLSAVCGLFAAMIIGFNVFLLADLAALIIYALRVGLAADFQQVLDGMPSDWTDLELDLRIEDESRLRRHRGRPQPGQRAGPTRESGLGLASAGREGLRPRRRGRVGARRPAQARRGGVAGELAVREVREGRSEIVQMWGRPESVREEFRQRRAI